MKCGEGKGGWCTRACSRAHGHGLWWNISEGWETIAKHVSGKYFHDCKAVSPTAEAQNDADARRLWDVSAQLAGLAD